MGFLTSHLSKRNFLLFTNYHKNTRKKKERKEKKEIVFYFLRFLQKEARNWKKRENSEEKQTEGKEKKVEVRNYLWGFISRNF
jgi:hypothetical protein